MLKRDKQTFIFHHVNLPNGVLSAQLSQNNKVSVHTKRRNIKGNAEEKRINKFCGAFSNSFQLRPHYSELIYSLPQKKIIAKKPVLLIKDGLFVLTGCSKNLSVARLD